MAKMLYPKRVQAPAIRRELEMVYGASVSSRDSILSRTTRIDDNRLGEAASYELLVAIWGRRTLTGEGVLAAALFLYGAWALGGWAWLAPPAIVVLAAPWLPRNPSVPSVAIHGVFPVIALSAAGLVFLVVHTLNGAALVLRSE
jgi:hypothetical protein